MSDAIRDGPSVNLEHRLRTPASDSEASGPNHDHRYCIVNPDDRGRIGPDSDQDSAPTPGAIREGPPVKPEHFRSVAELNQYLADLTDCALLLSYASKLDTK